MCGLASKCLEVAKLLHPLAGRTGGPQVRCLQFEWDTLYASSFSPPHPENMIGSLTNAETGQAEGKEQGQAGHSVSLRYP